MSPSDTNPTSPVPSQLGRYQLLDKLGQGGMGEVYLAHDASLDRQVALKLLPQASVHDPDALTRFRREARALAKLSHPGIVQAFDSDAAEGRHFLVMEYVAGHSLSRLLKEHGRLPPGLAADYIRQAALALQHAHARGLIHRDLKPSNLLVTPQGQVKLLDLGLARFLQDQVGDSNLTREGAGMGTPDYCAPEQYRDAHSADGRADIYALGCTLYQLLTGRVPFPGSSLSEKYRAHAEQEPQPVGGSCPEVPVGLVLVLRRMMAKRPQDRFRTAGQAAEALAPFVADCSPSAAHLQTSASWDGSQLTMTEFSGRMRRRKRWGATGIAAAFAVLLALLVWSLSRPGGNAPADKGGAAKDGQAKSDSDPKSSDKKGPAALEEPNVLTVAQDGSGRFRSLKEALASVDRPGMTIRVLDAGVYEESVLIDQKVTQANLRLEALRRATLSAPRKAETVVSVRNVPGVVVRGLRLRLRSGAGGSSKEPAGIEVFGQAAGTRLEDLEVLTEEPTAIGIALLNLDLPLDAEPVVVQGCRLGPGGKVGIAVSGLLHYPTADPCRRVIVRNNQIERCRFGVLLTGTLEQVHLVGNRIWGSDLVGIQIENVLPGTQNVLIANNTLFNCRHGFRVWDEAIKGKQIQFRNNLILASRELDMAYLQNSRGSLVVANPGDGQAVRRSTSWKVANNWREGLPPREGAALARAWVPADAPDVLQEQIGVVSRKPGAPGFLRPPLGSPLGTEGAGKTDPSLPSYVGAVPPEGVQAWDWHRTWLAPPPGKLLTVSQRPQDGGEYRSINAALAEAKPWATIRVLDAETYHERIVLDDPKRHQGIVLEAPQRAALKVAPQAGFAITVRGVAHVRVRHFKFHVSPNPPASSFVVLSGHTPGVVLAGLDHAGDRNLTGVNLQQVHQRPQEDPLVIRDCNISTGLGVVLTGAAEGNRDPVHTTGVAVVENRITAAYTGLIVRGQTARILVAANRVWACPQAALQAEDLGPSSSAIVLVNNTAFESGAAFRLWNNHRDERPSRGQLLFWNNLFFEGREGDLIAVVLAKGGEGAVMPELAQAAAAAWRFGCNWRDTLGDDPARRLVLARGDYRLEGPKFVSRDPKDPAFMRPTAREKWALQGAGLHDPTLPRYVGAVPPRGVEPWDWSVTWRAWMRRDLPIAKADLRKKAPAGK